jgi:hypothetical protein
VSLWGVHVGIAGITTALVLFVVAPGYRYRGLAVAASGAWAVAPDFHHALGAFPAIQALWRTELHTSVLANLFWFHRWIDLADPTDSVLYSRLMWVALGVVLVAVEVAIRRRQRAAWSEPS